MGGIVWPSDFAPCPANISRWRGKKPRVQSNENRRRTSRCSRGFNPAVHAQRALEQSDHFLAPCGCGELTPLLDVRNQALDPIDVETHIRAEGDGPISEIDID